jgi:MinD-like ATPase involved in chromosome partitioning or flagellar assembly
MLTNGNGSGEPLKKIISTISNKGGVGKTVFAIELANYLGRGGRKVLLIDTDLNTGDISIKLGLRTERTLLDFFEKSEPDLANLIMRKYSFDLIPGAGGNFKFANINYQQKMRFIRAFKKISEEYDYTILDLGAGIERTTLDFSLTADYPVIITTAEDIQSGYGCAKAAAERMYDLEGRQKIDGSEAKKGEFSPLFVFNKTEKDIAIGIFNGVKKAAGISREKYGVPISPNYLGFVQADYRLIKRSYAEKHTPVSEFSPASSLGSSYRQMADYFLRQAGPPNMTTESPLNRIMRFFRNEKTTV